MKKIKSTSLKESPVKQKKKQASTKAKPTKKPAVSINKAEQDFGGLRKKNASSTESRKNVNADPNLIQANELDEE